MICKERLSDVRSIGGGGAATGAIRQAGASTHCNTLQNRRKSQLITFSSSSCDIKSSLSHEIILVNNSQYSNSNNNHKTAEMGSFGVGAGAALSGRASITSSCNNQPNARLSYAEEDMLLVSKGAGSGSASGSGSGSASAGSGHEADLEDDVFRRRSLEVEDDDDNDEDVDFDDEFGTRIERSNNANDDSGGGSYEDSHALQSSIGGSNRNSLEKDDDDDIDADVISTDVSCYDQLLGSSCNTRNDEDIATIMGDAESYTKLCKTGSITRLNGGGGGVGSLNVGGGGGVGENCGIIYANPFMDDEGIAESGM